MPACPVPAREEPDRESARNHWGKLALWWIYWHLLLPGRPIPLPARMSMTGKHQPVKEQPWLSPSSARPRCTSWDEALGAKLAARIGIHLTDAHCRAIRFLREDYPVQGETATLRRVSTQAGICVKDLFALFPGKPAKKMAYIAGMPNPHGCV